MSALADARKELEYCCITYGGDQWNWPTSAIALAALVAEIDAAPVLRTIGRGKEKGQTVRLLGDG